jgi:hypothetical protein
MRGMKVAGKETKEKGKYCIDAQGLKSFFLQKLYTDKHPSRMFRTTTAKLPSPLRDSLYKCLLNCDTTFREHGCQLWI